MTKPVTSVPSLRQGPWLLAILAVGCTAPVVALAGDPTMPASAASAQAGEVRALTLTSSPLIKKTGAGERGVALAVIDSGVLSNVTVRLSAPSWPGPATTALGGLPAGTNRVELEIPVLSEPTAVQVALESSSGRREFGPFTLAPARKWTVYLSQHTHTDIGYTRPQTEILPEHLRYIDYALDYCDLTDAYPDDARFRWTCETSWAVREYLQRRPARQIERLKRRVQEGRVEVTGWMLNMSEIATESSLAAFLQPLRAFKESFGVPVRTAMQNDVNGAAWCLVDYGSDIGLKYLSMGINQTRSILPFDKPTAFWWESPSGKRLLAYRADHYMTANFWHLNDGRLATFQPEVVKYLLSLETRGYPFDRIGVQFSGYYTDNAPPSTVACDVVKAWNEKYAWPRLRLSTAQEFLAYVEKEHGPSLPVHRQAWPDWWTDGFGSAARETGAARETETAMQVSQGLLAIAAVLGADIRPAVLQRITEVQDALLFYAEHTYGAAESIDDPLAENSQVQWGEKASYVWDAVKESNLLREEAFGLVQDYLPRVEVPTIAVFNTLNWSRSGLVRVFIDHEILPAERAYRITEAESGARVLAQPLNRRSEGTYWALWVKGVPPLGYKVLRIEVQPGKRDPEPASTPAEKLENAFYTLTLDPARGAVKSLIDKETSQELVDANAAWGLGQCLYETLSGGREMKRENFKRTSLRNIQVQPGASGPIWKSLSLTADLDGCATNRGVRLEVRLYEPEKRVEFHFALRKLPVRGPEAVYVAFPFRWPDGQIAYEAQGGFVTPGTDQIPGSSSDWQTVQNVLAVRSPAGQILWSSDQVPLVQLGDFNLGKWQRVTRVDQPHVYSWVMNNYWFTNFRAEQEGEFKWSYALTSTTAGDRALATRFGWGSRVPLTPRVLPPGKTTGAPRPFQYSALSLEAPNLLLVEAKPARDGEGVVFHLRDVAGQTTTLTEANVAAGAEMRRADEVNVLEEVTRGEIELLTLAPWESRFLRLQFR